MQRVMAETSVSISELKKNPTAVMERSRGAPFAILSRNRVMGYLIEAETFEEIVDRLEDFELSAVADARRLEPVIEIALDDL